MQDWKLLFKTKGKIDDWLWFVIKLLCICLAIFIINSLIFCFAVVHGSSMNHTLQDRDLLFVWKFYYSPDYGDVVICHTGKGYESEMIKRIVGLPGDIIDISDNGTVIRNGAELQEDYCAEKTFDKGDINYPIKVPVNQYFVMGDNRNDSIDSRYGEIGTLPKKNIDGKALLRIFPFWRITIL